MGASKWWIFGGTVALNRHSSAGWNPVELQLFVSNIYVQMVALGFNAMRLLTIFTWTDTYPAWIPACAGMTSRN